jgi:putative ABC transport system permease protein
MRVGELLALLAVIALVNAIALTLRTARREIALHRALGFTGGQVIRVHLWQSLVIAVVGILIGGSVGLMVGRAVERQLVENVGAIATTVVPATVWLVPAIAVAACLLAGIVTGGLALRHRPGQELRTE